MTLKMMMMMIRHKRQRLRVHQRCSFCCSCCCCCSRLYGCRCHWRYGGASTEALFFARYAAACLALDWQMGWRAKKARMFVCGDRTWWLERELLSSLLKHKQWYQCMAINPAEPLERTESVYIYIPGTTTAILFLGARFFFAVERTNPREEWKPVRAPFLLSDALSPPTGVVQRRLSVRDRLSIKQLEARNTPVGFRCCVKVRCRAATAAINA